MGSKKKEKKIQKDFIEALTNSINYFRLIFIVVKKKKKKKGNLGLSTGGVSKTRNSIEKKKSTYKTRNSHFSLALSGLLWYTVLKRETLVVIT